MCSGYPPFRKGGADDHYTAVVRRHLKADRPVLKEEIPGFDEELSDLCRRMMSRRPDVRPTLEELAEQMLDISQRMRGRIPPRHTKVDRIPSAERPALATATPAVDSGPHEPPRNRTPLIAVALGVGIAIGVVASLIALSMN